MVDTFTLLNSRIKQYMYTCKKVVLFDDIVIVAGSLYDDSMHIRCHTIFGNVVQNITYQLIHVSLYLYIHTHTHIYIYIYNVLYIMMPVTFQDTQDLEKEHNHLNLSD